MSSEASSERNLERQNAADSTNSRGERFISFSLGQEEFAIPLLAVKEVIAMPEITPIPFSPTHFLGIMNLRGQVISVVDLRLKLNIKPQTSSELAVIICDIEAISLGVVVDSINSVISPLDHEISPRPDLQGQKNTDYILNVIRKDKKHLLLLDITKTLGLEDMQLAKKNLIKKI